MNSIEPLISISLRRRQGPYAPGDILDCEYQVDAVPLENLLAVEASVLWHTEGKGEEDLAVHFFERRTPADTEDGDLRPMRKFLVELPNSPLSYDGVIVKVLWCVRVRVFLRRGREVFLEEPFILGEVPRGLRVCEAQAKEGEEDVPDLETASLAGSEAAELQESARARSRDDEAD